ncbi:flagellar hook capping FlgD N-terminal domain-containing protein [Paenibacillus sp. DMB20]|uniref:flagellar hook capping FlgD N-terminal domain-containing protein n=1 Tax=Paenibacillus sp. DMB20 TaxID=1642570 RepID=UPI0006280E3F|nr:flagellar hook capping FlgD N-terminal domain-containing protein [Paenibacillus sp. DMB20]KKO51306.1 hypothetical protein XI25_27200 [Paenibacillus sp. DMB20]
MASNSNMVSKSVWPYYSTDNIKKAGKTEEKTTLGKDQFLSILIKQLQYQDPLQPMEDKEFIAQMAQFTSLEQLMNISSQLTEMRQSLGAASSLIGKKVSWIETAKDKTGTISTKSGVVDSILIRDGKHFAKIGKDEIALDNIIQIENNVQDSGEVPETGGGTTDPGSGAGETGGGTTNPGSGAGGTGGGTT